MKICLYPSHLRGTVKVPVSKSLLHRHLILSALAGDESTCLVESDDIFRTVQALKALRAGAQEIDCGMSGSTLRFLLPLAMAQGKTGTIFTGDRRLLERPVNAPLPMERVPQGWRVTGKLLPGTYYLAADETSQMVSGLLMALPLLEKMSKIMLTTNRVSQPYIDMTAAVMEQHGVTVKKTETGYEIPAPQSYQKAAFSPEGDWSAAAWYAVMSALQGDGITVKNTVLPSLQGDSQINDYVNLKPGEIAISQTPDLLPPLALWAALQAGRVTHFTHGAFLRRKESDRLHNTAYILNALGGRVSEEPDGLTVCGVARLRGGVTVDGCRDHRMVMLAAFVAALCEQPVVLTGAEFVEKSYRAFWQDYTALGGRMEVVQP